MLADCFQSMVPATLPPSLSVSRSWDSYRWVILFVILSFWIMATWALMVMPAMATMPYPLWCLTWGMPVKVILSPTEYLGSVSLRRSTNLRIFGSWFYSFLRWETVRGVFKWRILLEGETGTQPMAGHGWHRHWQPEIRNHTNSWKVYLESCKWTRFYGKKCPPPKVCRDVMFVNFCWVQHLEICDIESLM